MGKTIHIEKLWKDIVRGLKARAAWAFDRSRSTAHARAWSRLLPLFLLINLFATSGCISSYVVQRKAKPHLDYDPAEQKTKEVPGKPAYYTLLPLTIAADAATCPFQLIYFGSRTGTASVDGWPIPLP